MSSTTLSRLTHLTTTIHFPRTTRRTTANNTTNILIVCNQRLRRPFTTSTNKGKTSSSSSSTNNSDTKKSFFDWYEYYLQSSPIRTKMATGGLLWGIGDIVAQSIPFVIGNNKTDEEKIKITTPSNNNSSYFLTNYDIARTGRAMFFGFAIHATTAHVHYNFLESLTVRFNIQGLYIPVFKAFMEQFVYWSWISNGLYHGVMGAMQGMSATQIYKRLCEVLWETQKAQWVFWIPVQLINFRYVPVRHQLNIVLLTSVVWTAFLSFAFPPVVDDVESVDDGKKKEIQE